jgi:hypothetical protein
MSVLRRIASALSSAPEGSPVTPPGSGPRKVVNGGPPGTGSGVRRADAATAGVPRGRRDHAGWHRRGGDWDHLVALWIDLGGSD